MREIGIEETEAHVRELNGLLLAGLDELGARVVTPRAPEQRGALVCVASTDVDRLVAALADGGVVTSSRDDNLRISAHCYNTAEDVSTVLDLLAQNRSLLRLD
jgi:selenocysteine lyase/cysteine desulfurase